MLKSFASMNSQKKTNCLDFFLNDKYHRQKKKQFSLVYIAALLLLKEGKDSRRDSGFLVRYQCYNQPSARGSVTTTRSLHSAYRRSTCTTLSRQSTNYALIPIKEVPGIINNCYS